DGQREDAHGLAQAVAQQKALGGTHGAQRGDIARPLDRPDQEERAGDQGRDNEEEPLNHRQRHHLRRVAGGGVEALLQRMDVQTTSLRQRFGIGLVRGFRDDDGGLLVGVRLHSLAVASARVDLLPDVQRQVGDVDVAEGALPVGEAGDRERGVQAVDGDRVPDLDAFVGQGGGKNDLVRGVGLLATVGCRAHGWQAGGGDEGVGRYAGQGKVRGGGGVVVGVGYREVDGGCVGDAVGLGHLFGIVDVDDGAGERGVRLGAAFEGDDVRVQGLQARNAVVDKSCGEAGDDDDEQGHQPENDAHQEESGSARTAFRARLGTWENLLRIWKLVRGRGTAKKLSGQPLECNLATVCRYLKDKVLPRWGRGRSVTVSRQRGGWHGWCSSGGSVPAGCRCVSARSWLAIGSTRQMYDNEKPRSGTKLREVQNNRVSNAKPRDG